MNIGLTLLTILAVCILASLLYYVYCIVRALPMARSMAHNEPQKQAARLVVEATDRRDRLKRQIESYPELGEKSTSPHLAAEYQGLLAQYEEANQAVEEAMRLYKQASK